MKKTEITIFTLLFACAISAFAGIGTVSVTTSETQVLPAKADRRWLVLQNNSTNDIYVKLDSSTNSVTTTNGVKVAANGGTISITAAGANPARNTITAISASGTNALSYQEGNEGQ